MVSWFDSNGESSDRSDPAVGKSSYFADEGIKKDREVVEAIERARKAQQLHEQQHDVQLVINEDNAT